MMYLTKESMNLSIDPNSNNLYFESSTLALKSNYSTTLSSGTTTTSTTFNKTYTIIPRVAYGIKNYRRNILIKFFSCR